LNGYVVDTCVLLDVFGGVEPFASRSADALDAHQSDGLVIAPITYVELAPAFRGNLDDLDDFLWRMGIRIAVDEPMSRLRSAAKMWARHVELKRKGEVMKRPMADLLIGTCAMSYQGLITRNGKDFVSVFPSLMVIEPS